MSGKKNLNLAKIFWLAINLEYCRLTLYNAKNKIYKYQVKGDEENSSLINTLKSINSTIQEYNITPTIQKQIVEWLNHLNNSYVKAPKETPLFNFDPININYNDSNELIADVEQWEQEISNVLDSDFYAPCKIDTALIDKSKLRFGLGSFLKDDSLTIISENAENDLNDAIKCILYSLPTPAAMITFRASEEVLRLYYEKKTPNSAEGKRWYEIIQELSKIEGTNKPFVDYLNYIRTERNKAEHPDKTFTQSESEHAFMQVIHLIEVISKDVK